MGKGCIDLLTGVLPIKCMYAPPSMSSVEVPGIVSLDEIVIQLGDLVDLHKHFDRIVNDSAVAANKTVSIFKLLYFRMRRR